LAISFFVVLPGIRGKEVSIMSWNINVIKRFLKSVSVVRFSLVCGV
jgi:hypothetical protein